MVPDRIEGRATARLKGILQKKTMRAGGKPVSPVFGTLTHVLNTLLWASIRRSVDWSHFTFFITGFFFSRVRATL